MKRSKSLTNNTPTRVYDRSLKGRYRRLTAVSKKRGLRLSISYEQFCKIADEDCHYCFAPTNYFVTGYSLDRIVNSLGYTKNNVVPCCKNCNMIKGDSLTEYEMLIVAEVLSVIRQGK